MLFSLEQDTGNRILFYVVPDGSSLIPSVTLRSDGKDIATVEATRIRPNLVSAGRHETGRCGFMITAHQVPGLSRVADIEILDAESDMLLYRRRPESAKDLRLFRLETHLLPLWRLDLACKGGFHYWYKGIERYGLETSTQIFSIKDATSLYISGRIFLRRFENHLRRDIKRFTLVRDPFHELAERLIVLQNIGSRAEEILGPRDALHFDILVKALGGLTGFDESDCKKFFKRTSREVLSLLTDPLVKQMTGATSEDKLSSTNVSMALDALASFEILGVRSDADAFKNALSDLLEIDAATIPTIDEYPRIIELGERLRQMSSVEALLEKDLEVFQCIDQALNAAKV